MKFKGFLASCLLAVSFASAFFTPVQAQEKAKRPASEIAMYGNPDKPQQLSKKDEAYIASLEKSGKTRQGEAKELVHVAWQYYQKANHAQAMRRFNQAWLLDQENGDVYHGFAVITLARDKAPVQAEKFFRTAIEKPGVNVNAYVDYGRLLWLRERLEESQEMLEKALKISPKAHNARANLAAIYGKKRDFAKACEFAREAKTNGDSIKQSFIEDVCAKGATG